MSRILNEVCGIATEMQGNGWVVTSRQGQPHVWSRMKREQKMVLEPLPVEDAMVALWRQIRKIETGETDDGTVMKAVKELKKGDTDEYQALTELCGDDGVCSFAGLPLALVQAGAYMAQFECSFSEYLNMFKNPNRMEDRQHIMKNTEDVKQIRESQRSIWTTWKISVEKLSETGYAELQAMAMLGPCGVAEGIVKGIVKGLVADEEGSVDWVFRRVVIDEMVHGSSLVSRDEGESEGQEKCIYKIHRLVRRFILSDIDRGSAVWNKVYSVALVCVHESVKAELRKEGKSYEELPYVFGTKHREIGAHAASLIDHHALPMHGAEILHFSEVQEIHRYSGKAMEFMGKVEEELQVWKRLLTILEHPQAVNRTRSCYGPSLDVAHEQKFRVAATHRSLGNALRRNGKLHHAASVLDKALRMELAIYGPNKPHLDIAIALSNLGTLYKALGKLENAVEKNDQSLKMYRTMHGPGKPHPDIATAFNELGCVYEAMGKFNKAEGKHKQSLERYRAIHGPKKPHPTIAMSLNNLGCVYKALVKIEKEVEMHERSLEMELAIHGPGKPHRDIATSLNNLGCGYESQGKLEKAVEKHKQSLEMYGAIYGLNKPHPSIATSLNNLGNVYQSLGKLDEAEEMHAQSLKMELRIHGLDEPHPDIATSLNNLGNVCKALDKLDKAKEKHKQSLDMKIAIHGPNKSHPDIATSLENLGHVYEALGKSEKAVEKYEQSLEMYRAFYGTDNPHSDIAMVLNTLGNVYQELGIPGKALERHEQSLHVKLEIHGSNKPHPDIAMSLYNLGCVYEALGKLNDAIEKHEQSMEMELVIHG